jgi:hypothetical protein
MPFYAAGSSVRQTIVGARLPDLPEYNGWLGDHGDKTAGVMGPLIGGGVLIVAGVLLVVFRQRTARCNRRALRRQFGRLADDAASNATPSRTALVGLVAISIGIWLVIVQPGG